MKKRRKLQIRVTTLALIVIATAVISSTSTWLFLTYIPAAARANTSRQAVFRELNATSIYADANKGVVTVEGVQTTASLFGGNDTSTILGSGFVVINNGSEYVITNYHVVDGTSELTVTFYDGNGFGAKVVGDDPYSDLAVLSVPSAAHAEYHPLSLASSSSLTVGESVLAIGNPYGLTGSVTIGIISHLGRTIQESATGNFSIANMIQFSAPINPGNSGGPLLNRDGKVVGVTTATVSYSQGVGFAIPSDTIIKELPFLIKTGSYNLHAYMGIVGVDMNYRLAQELGTNVTYGVLIEEVVQGSPAGIAGLRGGTRAVTVQGQDYILGGDIIVSINGSKILNNDDLSAYLEANAKSGDKVQLGIIRSGTLIFISIVLGIRPPPPS